MAEWQAADLEVAAKVQKTLNRKIAVQSAGAKRLTIGDRAEIIQQHNTDDGAMHQFQLEWPGCANIKALKQSSLVCLFK